jgi:glucosamine-phosphate N-acetyltransferase
MHPNMNTQQVDSELQKFSNSKFLYRRLAKSDLNRTYLELMGQLTKAPLVDTECLIKEYVTYYENSLLIFVIVIIDLETDQVIGNGRLLIEPKMTRGISKSAHIEDIVVDNAYNGQGLGKTLLEVLKHLSLQMGCYKAKLDCSEKVTGFYEKCGFEMSGHLMGCYFVEK